MDSHPSCFHHWVKLEAVSYMGEGMAVHFAQSRKDREIAGGVLLHFDYSLPCLVMLVCMVVQILLIRRAFIGGSESGQDTAQHANLTIFFVSLLYFICNSAFAIIFSLSHAKILKVEMRKYKVLLMTVKFTFPLLKAALFPLIIILRKPSMREDYKKFLHSIIALPSAGYLKIKYWLLDIQGFEQLQVQEED